MNLFLLQTRGGGITGVTLLHFGNGVDEQAQRTRPNSVNFLTFAHHTSRITLLSVRHRICAPN